MKKLFLLFALVISGSSFSAKVNYDTLLYIAQTTTNREDFKYIQTQFRMDENEYSNETAKKTIIIAAIRTKELHFEFLHAQFKFLESIITTIHGNIGTAMKMVQEALAIFSKYHSLEAARCYNTMGSMIAGRGDTETGLKYLEKSILICDHFKTAPRYNHICCDNALVMGYIYILAKDYRNAKIYLNECLVRSEEIGYFHNMNSAYLNFADIYRLENNYPKALEMSDLSLNLSEQENAHNLFCVGLYRKGQIFYDMGELDSSLFYYSAAEEIGIRQNLNGRLLNIYKAKTAIYKEKNDFENASKQQDLYINRKVLIEVDDKKSRLEFAQTKFEVNEKVSQIKSLAVKNQHELERNKLLTLAITITAAGLLLLIGIIILIISRFRLNRKIQLAQQEKDLSLHQLTALRSQMNPHFIFNALNSIQDLVLKENTEKSYSYITKFAELVRKTMHHAGLDFIGFDEEITYLELYLELESLRFKKGLEITFESNNIKDIAMPPLLVQPFIENAIKHGLFHKVGFKKLTIEFELSENLICTIRDNGVGRKRAQEIQQRRAKSHQSFAVESIQDRFKLLKRIYGQDFGISYTDLKNNGEPTGTEVQLSIPYKQKF